MVQDLLVIDHEMTDHLARPGPMYWDWRCLVCGADVTNHTKWWQMVWRWITKESQCIEELAIGGLMRCCTGTWSKAMQAQPDGHADGDTLPCEHCSSRMIRLKGVWRWDHP